MALKPKAKQEKVETKYKSHVEAQVVLKDENNTQDERVEALEYLIETQNISHILKLANLMFAQNKIDDHIYIDMVFGSFYGKSKSDEDYDNFTISLQSINVYLRNAAITYLQNSDEEAAIFIEKLLQSKNKDIRIFAINILGDVKYEKSVDMLRYFLAQEDDVNAMMTAVDYLGEIGSEEDIPLLKTLKVAHKDDPYVMFGVDMAIDRIKG